jgi:hypothetical protein
VKRVLALGVLSVVVVAVALALFIRWDDERPVAQDVAASTSLAPLAGLFGDAVHAEVDVVLDPKRVDPASVLVSVDFGPLEGPALVVPQRFESGRSTHVRFRYDLLCLREDCRPRSGKHEVKLAPAVVRYRLVDGTRRTLQAEWPAPVVIASRLTAEGSARPVWRVREQPPPVSYRTPPTLVAAAGYSIAALLGLAAVMVIAFEALAFARRRRSDPLSGLTPLERALALLARAVADGGTARQRRALDRLARELRRAGDDDLAADARRLAWSRARPEGERVERLASAATARAVPA